jgi:SAM-dependent methyltransferase
MHRGVFENILRSIRQEGVARTARNVVDRLVEKHYERKLGIDSLDIVPIEALGVTDRQYHQYVATEYRTFRRLMRAVPIRAGRDVFLDYGSGKGRVLVMAATYPFAKVIGVEFSPELCRVARENVARVRGKLRCPNVEVVTRDAREYEVPPEVTRIYFFNPFHGEILDGVLENVHRSIVARPRQISILCFYAKRGLPFEAQISRCDWLPLRREIPLTRGMYAVLYGNTVATPG